MQRDIGDLGLEMLQASPVAQRMKNRPDFQDWVQRLAAVASRPELEPLGEPLRWIATDAVPNHPGAFQRIIELAPQVPLTACRAAAVLAIDMAEVGPGLLLAVAANLAWSRSSPDVYYELARRPLPGWEIVPYACAVMGVRAGSYRTSLELIDQAYDVVYSLSARWRFVNDDPELIRYRKLAHAATEAHERCVRDLADDLRDACGGGKRGFRPETCALLWALGFVPQSYAFANGTALPSRQLCRLVVRRSFETIRLDALVQNIWLSLRNRGPFDLRRHESLFAMLNVMYPPHRSDAAIAQLLAPAYGRWLDPNELFADVLMRWFRGVLNEDDRSGFTYALELFAAADESVNDRVYYLECLLLDNTAQAPARTFPGQEARSRMDWKIAQIVDRKRRWALLQPALSGELLGPHPNGLHELLESHLSEATARADSELAKVAFLLTERYRQATEAFWNLVVPISADPTEAHAAASLLRKEWKLLDEAAGAYFLMLTPALPRHYRRFEMAADFAVLNMPRLRKKMNEEYGQRQMERILRTLERLHSRMAKLAPRYARLRKEPPTWDDLVESLGTGPAAAAPHHSRGVTGAARRKRGRR